MRLPIILELFFGKWKTFNIPKVCWLFIIEVNNIHIFTEYMSFDLYIMEWSARNKVGLTNIIEEKLHPFVGIAKLVARLRKYSIYIAVAKTFRIVFF